LFQKSDLSQLKRLRVCLTLLVNWIAMEKIKRSDALEYHSSGRKGKIEVIPTKPTSTQRDLALAYSPGVAEPCRAIDQDINEVYNYTAKGNLVAVISNGTAVLGLGNIGPEASKPVMEGKGLLFKIFADIDVFDIELDAEDPEKFIQTVKAIAPTFGGINLEDIKAPEAFYIEHRLKKELNIPLMHDDQHGTAIISSAALINAAELAGKELKNMKVVVSGAGAAAYSCSIMYLSLGVKKENIFMFDSKGFLCTAREDLSKNKAFFAQNHTEISLEEAIKGADLFLGLSVGNIVTKKMVQSMAKNPIVFALANPDPEITYDDALEARSDVIMATGRSDNPNQVNNVLGFPYIFRGALDVRATKINEAMKLAAAQAIAELARKPVPEEVNQAYSSSKMVFGPEYIIPKPMDHRLLWEVSIAVAKAAIESGVAKAPRTDWDTYKRELIQRMGLDNKLVRGLSRLARRHPKRVVFAEGNNLNVIKAALKAKDEGICHPIILGRQERIEHLIEEHNLEVDMDEIEIIDIRKNQFQEKIEAYGKHFYEQRHRKGITLNEAIKLMESRNYFGTMMVEMNDADALISGVTRKYKDVIRPALQIIGRKPGVKKVAGMYILQTRKGPMFFADTTVNIDPTAEEMADIAIMVADTIRSYKVEPVVAMLSFSNFGAVNEYCTRKVAKATELVKERRPDITIDGEIQANFALNTNLVSENFPFSPLAKRRANTLIFPNLSAGNIAYKLIQEMEKVEVIGPILLGMDKSFHVLQLGCSIREIQNMTRIAVVDAHFKELEHKG
jgi:malate dehydrogenase (oxaloacetate-decarboxylating)(NADP+)